MALHDIDIDAALRRLSDRRIEEAMAAGKFDDLAGVGKPLNLEPMPADENARLMWWSLRILRQNDVTPDEVRYRKALDGVRERIDAATNESALPKLVAEANAIVHKINTMGTTVLPAAVVPVDLGRERQRLHERQS